MSYKKLLHDIKAIVLDVDGVLTDGRLLIADSGELLRTMNAKDGYAMKAALTAGLKVCIITGGRNEAVKKRLTGLGIEDVYLNAHDKMQFLNEYATKHKLNKEHIAYMGDDMPDVPVLQAVGLATCPQDAINEVKSVSHYISHKNGGDGCVRDLIEQVMKVQNLWSVPDPASLTSSF